MIANLILMLKLLLNDIRLRARLYLTNQTPILVYQMGKVGSSSISKSLKNSGIKSFFHLHYLLKAKDLEDRIFFDAASPQLPNLRFSRITQERKGRFLYENLIIKKKPVKVISLTREPIGRNVSAFFQTFERETGKKYEESNFSVQELTEIFLDFYPHSIPLNWFDNQIKTCLGIDVYEYPFPKEQGFLSINKDNIDLLLLKSEIPNNIKEKAIAEFLDMKEFKIVNANVGADKNYSNMYEAFKQSLQLPMSYLEEMCNSKYFNHFYTDEEIKNVLSKWTR